MATATGLLAQALATARALEAAAYGGDAEFVELVGAAA